MENKNCYTLGDLKKYIAECELPDDTPITIQRIAKEDETGGCDCELMAMESIWDDNNGKTISFSGYEDSLSNADHEEIYGDC